MLTQESHFFDAQHTTPSQSQYYHYHNYYHVWLNPPTTSVQHRKHHFLKLFHNLTSLEDDDHHHHHNNNNNNNNNNNDRILSPLNEQTSSSNNFISIPNTSSQQQQDCNSFIQKENTSPPLLQKLVDTQIKVAATMSRTMSRVTSQWLTRLRSFTCVVHTQDALKDSHRTKVQRVKVRPNKKPLKELSAVFIGQDIRAHQGSILTMKFSQDGHFLATAGEDGVVRIWQVVEEDRSNDTDVPDIDPSCIYFTINHHSQLTPLVTTEAHKQSMLKNLRKTSDSACVVVPSKVFRIQEKPLHELHGHTGEVLDLSWSRDNLLLSSSVDETVRLWRVGSDLCLKVFPHSNYVTCVQFNPVDDSYFISGSIDGKVRIWSISSSQVVDWTDIREIITAVTYNPDGKGGIIGSMTGCCRFFSFSDYCFQLEASVCLNSKKKSPCKRIISFQFCPQDASKVMVTCSDSYVRILQGTNVIGKYKGQGNQLCASFTSNGKHIVSACEDSNIYVWNCSNEKESLVYEEKTVRSSECFSSDVSVVVPWSGLKGGPLNVQEDTLPNSSPSPSYCQDESLLEPIPKGSATWPEEKLWSSSHYKFLKSCWQKCDSWGLVIVAAGWDGHIRSFLNYGLPVAL